LAYINEANEISEDDWEYLIARLRHNKLSWQQGIADCNPDAPNHWLNRRPSRQLTDENGQRVFDAAGKPVPQMVRLVSRHIDNPAYYDRVKRCWTPQGRAYMAMLNGLTGTRRSRLLLGQWVAASGVKGLRSAKLSGLQNGRYTVKLVFSSPDSSKHRFDVTMQGKIALTHLQPAELTAQTETLSHIEVTDGMLTFFLTPNEGETLLSGIEVIRE
jgi:hypothetical protein